MILRNFQRATAVLLVLSAPADCRPRCARSATRPRRSTASNRSSTEPGDVRDTSTPRALAGSLGTFVIGDALPPEKRAMLVEMLRTTESTKDLIRAGVPDDWEVGDKSGAADCGTRNDIAVVRPPGRAPIVLAITPDRGVRDATTTPSSPRRPAERWMPCGELAGEREFNRWRPCRARRSPPIRCRRRSRRRWPPARSDHHRPGAAGSDR